jgi:hypothetical protein
VKQTDLAYAAGLVDGEGYVTIRRVAATAKRKSPSHEGSLVVEMVEERPIRWLQDRFGGSVFHDTKKKKAYHRSTYKWHLNGTQVLPALKALKPFFKVKQEQARLIIAFYATRTRSAGRRLGSDEIAIRDKFYLSVRRLNRRPSAAPSAARAADAA